MPTYNFYNETTEEDFEDFFTTSSSKDEFLEQNSHIRQTPSLFAYTGDHLMGVGPKVDGGFTENTQRIAEAHPGSPLASRYGTNETNKKKKVRNMLSKHNISVK